MSGQDVYTVSAITALLKQSIEEGFPSIRIEGEISNFRPASSGHLYFSLKDEGAVIQAVMFRGRAAGLGFEPGDGMLVRASGALSVYAARGNYQLICESMERSGEGAILAMLEERKRRLAAEGLFDQDRKKPVPRFPSRIAVVTSPTGAAIRDILSVLSRRNAGISVTVLPAAVQGAGAAEELSSMIRIANLHRMADVIILGRGGGSLEDLLAFSEEILVRAVAESDLPIISAVGHEIDFPLCDFAADVRAPTPSAAAELVSGERDAIGSRVRELARALREEMESKLASIRSLLERFSPEELEYRFRNRYQPLLQRLDDAKEGLFESMAAYISDRRRRIELAMGSIEASNPLSILERGYAVVRLRDSKSPLVSTSGLSPGDMISVRLHKGSLSARTEEIRNEEI